MEQISLPFSKAPSYGRADFVVTPSNQKAYDFLMHWPQWETLGGIVQGAEGAGKTHLAHLWAEKAQARFLEEKDLISLEETLDIEGGCAFILDGVERFLPKYQRMVFHIFNVLKASKGCLLLTCGSPPKEWGMSLKDLESRVLTLPLFSLDFPDDMLFMSRLAKGFADQQIHVDPKVLDYLSKHMERSYDALRTVPRILGEASLQARHALTIPFVKKILQMD